jgi:hypothetical protein
MNLALQARGWRWWSGSRRCRSKRTGRSACRPACAALVDLALDVLAGPESRPNGRPSITPNPDGRLRWHLEGPGK